MSESAVTFTGMLNPTTCTVTVPVTVVVCSTLVTVPWNLMPVSFARTAGHSQDNANASADRIRTLNRLFIDLSIAERNSAILCSQVADQTREKFVDGAPRQSDFRLERALPLGLRYRRNRRQGPHFRGKTLTLKLRCQTRLQAYLVKFITASSLRQANSAQACQLVYLQAQGSSPASGLCR